MKQWFTGRFSGHYRGKANETSGLSLVSEAQHFNIEVYEALVSEIELGPLIVPPPPPLAKDESTDDKEPSAPPPAPQVEITAHHEPEKDPLHQHLIGKVHLVDPIRAGESLKSAAHDVLMSEISLSHGAHTSSEIFGRIEGTMSGWFTPPPPPEDPEFVATTRASDPPAVGWKTEPIPTSETKAQARPTHTNQADPLRVDHARAATLDDWDEDGEDASISDSRNMPEEEIREYPFFSVGVGVTALLIFFATPTAAMLFGGAFLLFYGIRRWLHGVIPDASAVRSFALLLGGGSSLIAVLLIAKWASLGCVALSPLPLTLLLGSQFLSSLMARPLPFALTSASLAAVLFQAYAEWALPLCGAL